MTAILYDLGMADHSRAQEAMEITLEDLDNQEFDTNEIMITVIGKRAAQCSWDDIQVTLNRTTEPVGAEEDRFYQVYRLEDPTRWFLIFWSWLTKQYNKNSQQSTILSAL